MSKRNVVVLDVREDLARGREPFARIMQTVSALRPNDDLLLIAPFEPVPLFGILAQRGFTHAAKCTDSGDYEVLFSRAAGTNAGPAQTPLSSPVKSAVLRACTGSPVVEVDARGLEPPQPLVKILEAVSSLPEGAELRALTDRRPMHLYSQLEERGFIGETLEQRDGSFVTHVRHR